MRAFLLAGGKGTRLLPYTTIFPKPLIPIGDIPVMELLLRQLRFYGVNEVMVSIGHLGHLIEAYFQDGSRFGMNIRYLREETPLGTAGAMAEALNWLGEYFLVLNGDLLTTLNFSELQNQHHQADGSVTVCIYPRELKSEFGVVMYDEAGWLTDYIEKPKQVIHVSMGCYVFHSERVAKYLEKGLYLDMPTLILRMKEGGEKVYCHAPNCKWLDIGRPEDHQLACDWFKNSREEFLPP